MKIAEINGWTILGDPHFVTALSQLMNDVEKIRNKKIQSNEVSLAEKKLAAIRKIVETEIAANPTDSKFILGHTLGAEYSVWRRAKFFQQYRLFFRFDSKSKVIILSWFNDENTKRAYESSRDAYLVFQKMLKRGRPPSNWKQLLDSIDL